MVMTTHSFPDSAPARSNNIVTEAYGTWLISFADLLVLLLCTFIMYFSQTYGPGHQAPETPTASHPAPQLGPEVANTIHEDTENRLVFHANDVSPETGFLNQERINLVKKVVDLGFYSGEWVSVSLCSGAFSEMMASNFLTLLKESGVPDQRIQVRFFGTQCSTIGVKDEPRGETIARLEILKNG